MAISVVAGIIVLSFIAFAVWCMRRKQKKKVSGFGGYVVPSAMVSSPQSGKLVLLTSLCYSFNSPFCFLSIFIMSNS